MENGLEHIEVVVSEEYLIYETLRQAAHEQPVCEGLEIPLEIEFNIVECFSFAV